LNTNDPLANFQRYRTDLWAFMSECVYTQDQVDEKNPIKQYPAQREYLKFCARVWQKFNFMALPKSRRMTMSWTLIGFFLWDTMFKKGRNQAFVSKKEDDAGDLVQRAEFIYQHIPKDKIPPELLPKLRNKRMSNKPPKLEFPEIHSKIQGFPMGSDQLRQFTFSGILGDESAFWPDAEDFYSSSLPTLEGGGRLSLISSVAPGFFKRIVFDTMNEDSDRDVPSANTIIKHPMQGVRFWRNPQNKFAVIEIHYTADPNKRDPEFKRMLKASLPRRKYLQEYELNWDTFEGLPVYGDYGSHHEVYDRPEPKLGLPLLCGWDFGLTPACIVGQLQGDQLIILREFIAKNKPISIFAPEVVHQLRTIYPEWHDEEKDYRHYIDPAGFGRKDTDASTCALIMEQAAKIKQVFPGAPMSNDFEARKSAVENFLIKHTRGGPGIQLYEPTAPITVKGFRGGYQYPESYGEIEPTKLRPLKNEYSHPHDALQYLCWGATQIAATQNIIIPTPSYGFQAGEPKATGAKKYGYI